MKDWIGNNKSIYTTLGASNHTNKTREENDYYATDPIAIDKLLNSGSSLSKRLWEYSCGAGHLPDSSVAYARYKFKKGHNGETILSWI